MLPASVRGVVIERAEGNPFFVEELVRRLIDGEGVLEAQNGSWVAHELATDFVVPDNVQAVLAARIDLLPPADKAGLQAAAVIGRTFWSGPVYELLADVAPNLRLLEERDFIRHRSGSSLAGEREFVIKHALTREVAYRSLPTAKRARLHAQFAAWLEQAGEGRDEHAALLAHHYAEAVRPEDVDLAWPEQDGELARTRGRAVSWLRRAAELAVGHSDIEEALVMLRRATDLEPGDVDLWWAVARASALKFDGEAFWEAMLRAIDAPAGDRQTLAELYGELGLVTTMRGAMWKCFPEDELVGGWVDRALELAEPGSRALAKAELAQANRVDDVEAADRAIGIAQRLDDVELLSYGYHIRAGIALVSSEYEQVLAGIGGRVRSKAGSRTRIFSPWNAYWHVVMELGLARFEEARRTRTPTREARRPLSAHHVVHAVSSELFVEEAAGRWGGDPSVAASDRTLRRGKRRDPLRNECKPAAVLRPRMRRAR